MKKQEICPVVVDLLPGYMEGLTEAQTAKWVEEHLEKCAYCRSCYRRIEEEVLCLQREEKKVERRFRRRLSRYRYQMLGLVIGILLGIFMIIAGIKTCTYATSQMLQDVASDVEITGGETDE